MWSTIAKQTCSESTMDIISFQTNDQCCNLSGMSRSESVSQTNFNQVSCNDEDMTFYSDEVDAWQQEHRLSFESFDNMLLEEPSSCHFRILETKPESSRKLNFSLNENRSQSNCSSTVSQKNFRMFNSLSSEASMEDDYMDLFEMESFDDQKPLEMLTSNQSSFKLPSNLNSLFSATIQTASPQNYTKHVNSETPEMRRHPVRRCLSMTDNSLKKGGQGNAEISKVLEKSSLDGKNTGMFPLSNNCFKRPDPPSLTCSPVQSKRYRFQEKENINGSFSRLTKSTTPVSSLNVSNENLNVNKGRTNNPPLRKCMSMNDADIMSALARSENNNEPALIGDFSRPFVLPLLEGRHRDLKSISSHTVARLLNGYYDDQIASYKIIDCRYPYEFEGGHIRGAKNLYTQEQIIEEFLRPEENKETAVAGQGCKSKRHIIIFHCEFSSERGPKLSRFLRNNDRARNTHSYPALDYPEIYLLHNGYKEFFETYAELCDPTSYRPMLEPSYNEAYRHFRAKSKSWNGDGLGGGTARLKKSRSRLML